MSIDISKWSACAIRAEWMQLLGFDAERIALSLKYDRPQSTIEEAYYLEQVQRMLEEE